MNTIEFTDLYGHTLYKRCLEAYSPLFLHRPLLCILMPIQFDRKPYLGWMMRTLLHYVPLRMLFSGKAETPESTNLAKKAPMESCKLNP